uniref:Innexin n=2 Tax=Plectus sambesii TaxID=2011161 RepID=A0A914X427_9BILA
MIEYIADYISLIHVREDGGDIINRFHYEYTPLLIVLSALTLAGKQYVGQPIQCWFPAEFTGAWEAYAESYCFVKNTYFLPFNDYIPDDYGERRNREIGYYQWVPLVLIIQAILFATPLIIWKSLHSTSGINVKSVLNSAASIKKKFDKKTRDAEVEKAAMHITEALEMQRELKTGNLCGFLCYGKHNGLYVTGLYLFTKLLYVINVVVQFFILNSFLGPQYTMWGYGILNDLANGREWQESGHFPRVTMCDFKVRVLGNIHRWTVQCVLMINMYNEKIYLFFWWWFMVLGFLSILSLFYWTYETVFAGKQHEFLNKYLRVTGAIPEHPGPKEKRMMRSFVSQSLRPDGVFLLRLIQTNGGDLLTGEIINKLYEQYRAKYDKAAIDRDLSSGFSETPDSAALVKA